MISVYADHNATTPIDPEVRAAMVEALAHGFGNPSSLHQVGQQARRLVERARAQVAALIGAEPDEIVFTSGGTEANNLAVLGAVEAAGERPAVVTSAIEHQAVLGPCAYLQSRGHAVAFAPVDGEGRIAPDALGRLLGPHVGLVSLMLANNDTGVIQPLAAVASRVSPAVVLHTDAVQAAGKLPIDVRGLGVALLSISSHKLNGPKGAGALFVRRGVHLAPRLHGGRQERVLRPGTENVPALVGFGKACALARARLVEDATRMQALRDRFERESQTRIAGTSINGGGAARLPNTSNLAFAGVDAEALTVNLDLLGVAASRGAACSAGDDKPSHVLVAMGQSDAQARSAVRFSFGRTTTDDEISVAVECLTAAVGRLRGART